MFISSFTETIFSNFLPNTVSVCQKLNTNFRSIKNKTSEKLHHNLNEDIKTDLEYDSLHLIITHAKKKKLMQVP